MAEAYLNQMGDGDWRAYSAGSQPTGKPNPFALKTLARHEISLTADTPRSKSWDEFATASAPVMEFVITVCDNAAGETCPIWPTQNGQSPKKHHWSFPDPAAVEGSDAQKLEAFESIFSSIRIKIDRFLQEETP